jgi:hypothetical protein
MKKFVIWFIDGFLTSIMAVSTATFGISLLTMILSLIEYMAGYPEAIQTNTTVTLSSFVFFILSVSALNKIEECKYQ